MSLIVQKFGGSSVRDAQRVMNVARRVTETYAKGNSVVVVVSAQGDTTDDLIEKAREINPKANKREMDVLLSSGEQISIALLAMAIEKLGYPAKSLTGWQAGFVTDSAHGSSRIRRIETERLRNELDKGNIVIVAGFQGLNPGPGGLGYQRRGHCRGLPGRSLPDLHRRGWGLYRGSPPGAGGPQIRGDLL